MDRKSSRGMLYENEELRLRTININAEVERGNVNSTPCLYLFISYLHLTLQTKNNLLDIDKKCFISINIINIENRITTYDQHL